MRFETAQVLEIASVTKDTLRHWKKILPPIAELDGRSVRYTLSDLVAVCVVSHAVTGLGVAISRIAPCSAWLFDEARGRAPDRLMGAVHFLPDGTGLWLENVDGTLAAAIVIRIGPILDRIKAAATSDVPSGQLLLPFPNQPKPASA